MNFSRSLKQYARPVAQKLSGSGEGDGEGEGVVGDWVQSVRVVMRVVVHDG